MSAPDSSAKSMRTALSRVRYLGAAHSGTTDFWRQRLTAVAMTLLILPVIVVVMMVSAALALHILLNCGKVLLRRREISRLQVLGQLLKSLRNRVAALRRYRGSRLR